MKQIALLPVLLLSCCGGDNAKSPAPKPMKLDTSQVFAASFSPDGKRIATGSDTGTVTVWDVASGKRLRSMQAGGKEALDRINTIKFSPNGKQVASGGFDSILRLWDVSSGKLLRTFQVNNCDIKSLNFSPNGQQIVSGASGLDEGKAELSVWSVASGKLVRTLGNHQEAFSVEFSPNGQQIVSGGWDGATKKSGVWVWSAKTGKLLRTFGSKQDVTSVSFGPNGRQIVSNFSDPTDYSGTSTKEPTYGFKLWNAATGKPIRTVFTKLTPNTVDFSPDGKHIVSSAWAAMGSGNGVSLWNATTGKLVRAITGEEDYPRFVSFSPNGKQLLSGGSDNQVRVWNVATGKLVRAFGKASQTF